MALPLAAAFRALKVVGPVVGPEGVKLAKKILGSKNLKTAAHEMAWQRGGLVGEVRFADGAKRWVVVSADHEPIAAFPPYGTGDASSLEEGLRGIDFERCVGPPIQQQKHEKQAEKDA